MRRILATASLAKSPMTPGVVQPIRAVMVKALSTRVIDMIRVALVVAFAHFMPKEVAAQDSCDAILRQGVHEFHSFELSKTEYWLLRSVVESSSSFEGAREQAGGLMFGFLDVQLGGTHAESSWTKWKTEFMKMTYSEVSRTLRVSMESTTVSKEIVAAWSSCVESRRRGLKVWTDPFSHPSRFTIHYEYIPHSAKSAPEMDLLFVGSETADEAPAVTFKVVTVDTAAGQELSEREGAVESKADLTPKSIECFRTQLTARDGRRYLPECRVTIVGSTYRPLRFPRVYLDEFESKLRVTVDSSKPHNGGRLVAITLSADDQGNELLGNLGRVGAPGVGVTHDFGKGFTKGQQVFLGVSAASGQYSGGANVHRGFLVWPGKQTLFIDAVKQNRSDGSVGVTYLSEVTVSVEWFPKQREFN